MIALLGALPDELIGVAKDMVSTQHTSYRGWRLIEGKYANKKIVLMQTGMGKDRAKQATEYLLEHYSVSAVISLGFGGSLVADLEIGDLVLCREVFHHNHPDSQDFFPSDPNLIATATRIMEGKPEHLLIGNGLTVDQLAFNPEEKAALGKIYQAQVVDMESFWVAEIVAHHKIPFLGLRAISDTLYERLPPFDHFLGSEGEWLGKEALRHFLLNPNDLKIIPLLYMHTRKARKSLTEFLRALVPEIPLEMIDESNAG
jgi:adenosylhomocysteine nucleosidase